MDFQWKPTELPRSERPKETVTRSSHPPPSSDAKESHHQYLKYTLKQAWLQKETLVRTEHQFTQEPPSKDGRMAGGNESPLHEPRGTGELPLKLPPRVKTRLLLFKSTLCSQVPRRQQVIYSACCTDKAIKFTDKCVLRCSWLTETLLRVGGWAGHRDQCTDQEQDLLSVLQLLILTSRALCVL